MAFGLDSNLSCLSSAQGVFLSRRALESKSTKRYRERSVVKNRISGVLGYLVADRWMI